MLFADAVSNADVVIVALPFAATAEVLPTLASALAGKMVVDATNPVQADWSPLPLGAENSAGEETARCLTKSKIVKAFNTVFADVMTPPRLDRRGRKITVFVAGDYADANNLIARLSGSIGFAPLVTGPLKNARYLEAMAHLNIAIAMGGGGTNAAILYDQVRG